MDEKVNGGVLTYKKGPRLQPHQGVSGGGLSAIRAWMQVGTS